MSRRVSRTESDSRSHFDAKRAERTLFHVAAQRITEEAQKWISLKSPSAERRAPSTEGGAGGNEQSGKREDERETK